MKTLRKMTAAALLACVLAVSASAGEMSAGYAPPPPPPPDPPPASAVAGTETDESGDITADLLAALLNGLLAAL